MEVKMRVRITRCLDDRFWYSKQIDKEFNVLYSNGSNHTALDGDGNIIGGILKSDCEIIKEKPDSEEMKIIQFASAENGKLYALCADGSLWQGINPRGKVAWEELNRPVRSVPCTRIDEPITN
jgi:hypothetical protein